MNLTRAQVGQRIEEKLSIDDCDLINHPSNCLPGPGWWHDEFELRWHHNDNKPRIGVLLMRALSPDGLRLLADLLDPKGAKP